jgi:putative permease
MLEVFKSWYHRYLSDPQAVLLLTFLVLGFGIVITFGIHLAPFFAALVIAYLLETSVQQLQRVHLPRLLAVVVVFVLFMAVLIFLLLGLMPLVSRQLADFMQKLPAIINEGQQLLRRLPERYPQFISVNQIDEIMRVMRAGISDLGQNVVSLSLASIPALITLLVYLILVPLLVFFMLKDKTVILDWVSRLLPTQRSLMVQVWHEMDNQIGNYVRGKIYEIFIVGGVTYLVFSLLGLSYAPLLAVLVGLSVIIPYIGAAVVTVPVALGAYVQWGWSPDFTWLMLAYMIIQVLDGNLLVPLLFSEAVNLHPVAIIVAVLVFGALWGFWGVFFAIPLATLVKALINAWPRPIAEEQAEG